MTFKMRICQQTLTKKMHNNTHNLTNSHILLRQTHGREACDAEVFLRVESQTGTRLDRENGF